LEKAAFYSTLQNEHPNGYTNTKEKGICTTGAIRQKLKQNFEQSRMGSEALMTDLSIKREEKKEKSGVTYARNG